MLIYIDKLTPWGGEAIDGIQHPLNIEQFWTDDELATIGLARPVPFVPPEGKREVGTVRYVKGSDGKVHEDWDVEDVPAPPPPQPSAPTRRLVRKSTIIRRLQEVGLLDQAFAVLDQNLYAKARFWTPDWPSIYFDDPEAVAILQACGADVDAIMAPEALPPQDAAQ